MATRCLQRLTVTSGRKRFGNVEMRVVVVAGDAGGAAAVSPVIAELKADGLAPVSLAYDAAGEVWHRSGIAFEAIPDDAGSVWVRDVLAAFRPASVLTGTSVNGRDLEKVFWREARTAGLPTAAVLDFQTNLEPRFVRSTGGGLQFPDRIAVMDSRARFSLIVLGADPDAVEVTGQPAFDGLAEMRDVYGAHERALTRASLGASDDEILIVFVSQPLAAVYSSPVLGLPSSLGYEEIGALRDVRESLAAIASSGCAVRLAIRLHPREDPTAIRALLADQPLPRGCHVTETIVSGGYPREHVLAADVVVGMMSILLAEACWLGRPTVSYQPGLIGRDPLAVNEAGMTVPAYRRSELAAALRPLVLSPGARWERERFLAGMAPCAGAARNVADLVWAMTDVVPEVAAA